jgi:alanine racemase
MPRPLRAVVDLAALSVNLALLRRHAGDAKVMAVAKADAYGHGLQRCLPALRRSDGLAVVEMGQALRIREAGFSGTVLLLEGAFDEAELALCARHGLATVVHEAAQLEQLQRVRLPRPLQVWLKMNSGMNRLGFPMEAFRRARGVLEGHGNVASLVLMTHFARADQPGGVTDALGLFERACAGTPSVRSCANSAALLRHPATRGDWVRPGIALYGASPFEDGDAAASLGLRPAMTLLSEVIAVQALERGDAVGYGGSFVAEGPVRVGIVACGYADGYPRHAPTGTPVVVAGVTTRTLGRVSMDLLAVDITPLPGAGVGAPVQLWGPDLPVDSVARAAGTVGYELLCALAPRVPVSVAPAPD